jgi:hypothetical protein
MKKHYRVTEFNVEDYNFRQLLTDLWGHGDLETLHKKFDISGEITMANNSDTKAHQSFYSKLNEGWPSLERLYNSFMRSIMLPLVGEEFIFQKWPTLRIHAPNNWATPEYHRDSQEGYNHPKGEMNFILPFTCCYDTNTVWTESESDRGDFLPIEMKWGELIGFNGGECRHGNKINKTPVTRVTWDFRLLPLSKYDPSDIKTSHTTGTRFELGHYYAAIS